MKRLLVLLLLAVPAKAQEASFTGTYRGLIACDRTADGRPGTFSLELDVRMLEDGDRLSLATWSAEDEASGAREPSLYDGEVRKADGRVSGYLRACAPDFDYQELIRIKPAIPDEDGFSFSADTVFVSKDLPGSEGQLMVESCRWVMKRVSSESPDMSRCDPQD